MTPGTPETRDSSPATEAIFLLAAVAEVGTLVDLEEGIMIGTIHRLRILILPSISSTRFSPGLCFLIVCILRSKRLLDSLLMDLWTVIEENFPGDLRQYADLVVNCNWGLLVY